MKKKNSLNKRIKSLLDNIMSGIVILKIAIAQFFSWIVRSDYFKKVELSALVHDEADIIYPKELHDIVPLKLKSCMEEAAALVCTKLPIPAEASTGSHWIH